MFRLLILIFPEKNESVFYFAEVLILKYSILNTQYLTFKGIAFVLKFYVWYKYSVIIKN